MGNMLFLCLSLSRIFTRVGHSAALPACSTDTTEKHLISDFQECCICWTALQAGSPHKRSQALLDNTYKMLTISYNSRFHSPREVAKSDSLYCNFFSMPHFSTLTNCSPPHAPIQSTAHSRRKELWKLSKPTANNSPSP